MLCTAVQNEVLALFTDSLHIIPLGVGGNIYSPYGLEPLLQAPDSRAGGGAPAMESRLSTLATCGLGVRTSLEATTG